jgi:hypothetical protein
MNISKEAQKDAVEYARAQMFFGDGAGIRRRIIDAKVSDFMERDPKYAQAFELALSKQNWADAAAKAVKERKRIDRGKSVNRNMRAVLTGDRSKTTSSVVAVLMIAGYAAHEIGYDKIMLEESKKQYRKAKAWVRQQRARRNATNVTNIAN